MMKTKHKIKAISAGVLATLLILIMAFTVAPITAFASDPFVYDVRVDVYGDIFDIHLEDIATQTIGDLKEKVSNNINVDKENITIRFDDRTMSDDNAVLVQSQILSTNQIKVEVDVAARSRNATDTRWYYGSFEEAIERANSKNGTIQLLNSVSSLNQQVDLDRVTLDLKGHQIAHDGTQICVAGPVTITSSNIAGQLSSTGYNALVVRAGGNLTISNVELIASSSASSPLNIHTGGVARIQDGMTFDSENANADSITVSGTLLIEETPTFKLRDGYVNITISDTTANVDLRGIDNLDGLKIRNLGIGNYTLKVSTGHVLENIETTNAPLLSVEDYVSCNGDDVSDIHKFVKCTQHTNATYTAEGHVIKQSCICGESASIAVYEPDDLTFDGTEKKAVVVKGAGFVGEYSVTYSGDNVENGQPPINVGVTTAHVTVNGHTARITYRISPKRLTELTFEGLRTSYEYTGTALTPAVIVKDGNTLLIEGRDYTLMYSGNYKAGTATVLVMLQGNYTGNVSKTFEITDAAGKAAITSVSINENGELIVYYSDDTNVNLGVVKGADGIPGISGEDGVGISKLEKTGRNGLTDTYTITFTNGSTTTFLVTNGKDGADGLTVAATVIGGIALASNIALIVYALIKKKRSL